MSDEPDFFKQATTIAKKLAWVDNEVVVDENISQMTITEFRSYLATVLALTYKNGQNDVRKKIRKALDIS